MNPEELAARFACLTVWRSQGRRAPHKPLLLLWAIARCLRGQDRLVPYLEVDPVLRTLLRSFGPHHREIHPEYPFWRLQNDGIWEVPGRERVALSSSGDPRPNSLRANDTHAGLSKPVYAAFREDPNLAERIAYALVEAHFPWTLQDEVLEAVGIEQKSELSRRRYRDPRFSESVMEAYGYRCAVCGFAVRLGDKSVALEAAHIRWHQALGPGTVRNGLCLCALHHRLFDKGAFTLSAGREVIVSGAAQGQGFDETLGRFSLRSILRPSRHDETPDAAFLRWHAREVFAGPSE